MKSMSNPDLLRLYLCPIDPLRDVDNLAATQNILREKSESNVPGAGSLLEDRYGPDVAGIRRRDRCRGPSITCDRRAGAELGAGPLWRSKLPAGDRASRRSDLDRAY